MSKHRCGRFVSFRGGLGLFGNQIWFRLGASSAEKPQATSRRPHRGGQGSCTQLWAARGCAAGGTSPCPGDNGATTLVPIPSFYLLASSLAPCLILNPVGGTPMQRVSSSRAGATWFVIGAKPPALRAGLSSSVSPLSLLKVKVLCD